MHMVGLQVSFQHSPLLLPESSNSCGPPAKPGVYPREIREDRKFWHDIEKYVRERAKADSWYGIFPDCLKKY